MISVFSILRVPKNGRVKVFLKVYGETGNGREACSSVDKKDVGA